MNIQEQEYGNAWEYIGAYTKIYGITNEYIGIYRNILEKIGTYCNRWEYMRIYRNKKNICEQIGIYGHK